MSQEKSIKLRNQIWGLGRSPRIYLQAAEILLRFSFIDKKKIYKQNKILLEFFFIFKHL